VPTKAILKRFLQNIKVYVGDKEVLANSLRDLNTFDLTNLILDVNGKFIIGDDQDKYYKLVPERLATSA
jgi:hypothetical protein